MVVVLLVSLQLPQFHYPRRRQTDAFIPAKGLKNTFTKCETPPRRCYATSDFQFSPEPVPQVLQAPLCFAAPIVAALLVRKTSQKG
jgi:hypothetical protein